MSRPSELYVSHENGKLVEIYLGKRAAMDLFDYMLPRIGQAAPGFEERFEYGRFGGFVSITTLPQKYFSAVYALIMRACDEVESLAPFKDGLRQVLQSDSRYCGQEK